MQLPMPDNDSAMQDVPSLDAAIALASVAAAAADGSAGKQHRWRHVTACYSTGQCSFDTLLCVTSVRRGRGWEERLPSVSVVATGVRRLRGLLSLQAPSLINTSVL